MTSTALQSLKWQLIGMHEPQWRRQGWGGAAGARAPAVKPCAPAVPRYLSYSDVDHKRISWLSSEQQIILKTSTTMLSITLNSFLVSMADIR